MRNSIVRQLGHVSFEWTLVTLIVMTALFLPLDGDKSAVVSLMDAVRSYHANASFAFSLP